jgi:hypothetical protein
MMMVMLVSCWDPLKFEILEILTHIQHTAVHLPVRSEDPTVSLLANLVTLDSKGLRREERISCPCRELNPGSSAHSPSVYRLLYLYKYV